MEALEKKADDVSIFSHLAERSLPPEIVSFRHWMQGVQRQRPVAEQSFRVAVYIRYYNQTRHHDYLEYHKKQYLQTLSSCPNWAFQGFYVDEGQLYRVVT